VIGVDSVGLSLWDPGLPDGVFYADPEVEPEWLSIDETVPVPEGRIAPRFFTVIEGKLVPVY
jgi:hypothetical protein